MFAGEATGDLSPYAAVDPIWIFCEVDDRSGLDLVVEDDREVARERRRLFEADRAGRLCLGTFGDRPGDVMEGFPPFGGESERDGGFAVAGGVFLLRLGDLAARECRVVF